MVTQKLISLKIDTHTLEELDKEVALGWRKRNTHINEAIKFYLEYLSVRRRIYDSYEQQDKIDEYTKFKNKWFPMMKYTLSG